MPNLVSFRIGWENENLARFILSMFSFVASPSTISDDIGSDFFCTLFQIQIHEDRDYLIPRNSFAIQIKSTPDVFNVTNKLEYLNSLEIPFFVGVIDRNDLKLTIYSGEYVPMLFSYRGLDSLKIELCESVDPDQYFTELNNRNYILKFPKVTEIKANMKREELMARAQTLYNVCLSIHKNIATRKSEEYIFEYKLNNPPGEVRVVIIAGSSSVKVFRDNFLKRLAEVFYNLEWLYQNSHEEFKEEEFRTYQSIYNELKTIYGNQAIPQYLAVRFDSLEELINQNTLER